jgi:hypothetical protein
MKHKGIQDEVSVRFEFLVIIIGLMERRSFDMGAFSFWEDIVCANQSAS